MLFRQFFVNLHVIFVKMNQSESKNLIRELLPEPTVKRLPWYFAYVSRLRALGVERVTSTQISKQLNVDVSQIAKDLSYLNVRGKTRIGYDVEQLAGALCDFLGFRREHKAVIFGAGSLGAALMSDKGLGRYGLDIVAGFDVNPDKIHGSVYHLDDMSRIIRETGAEIGIIAVPHEVAQQVADMAIEAGLKAIWNFTPHRLQSRPGVTIQDTSIYSHLALMYNRMEQQKQKEAEG